MRLRNKKTGEIVKLSGITCKGGITYMRFDDEKGSFKFAVHSLAELNSEWEDYEEPKTFFTIYYDGMISEFKGGDDEQIRDMKEIGNYFDTREEAEKAREKLKAFKRLRDKGFRFVLSATTMDRIDIVRECFDSIEQAAEARDDIITLFGGEECS